MDMSRLEGLDRLVDRALKMHAESELSLPPCWFATWPDGKTVCERCMSRAERREATEDRVVCWHVGETGFTKDVHCHRCGYAVAQKDEEIDE